VRTATDLARHPSRSSAWASRSSSSAWTRGHAGGAHRGVGAGATGAHAARALRRRRLRP
jgi:hypothetical protein